MRKLMGREEKRVGEGRGMRMVMMMKGEGKGERDHLKEFLQGVCLVCRLGANLLSVQITWYAYLKKQ